MVKRGMLVGLVALVVLGLVPAAANAHAQMETTSPSRGGVVERQPAQVEVRFDETVEGSFGAVRVYDRDGNRVEQGDAFHPGGDGKRLATRLKPGLADGTYTATFRVVSADGHVVTGGFVFSIGSASAAGATVDQLLDKAGAGPSTGVAFAAARAVQYAAIALALGAFAMALWFWPGNSTKVEAGLVARCRRMLLVAGVAGTLSAVVCVVLEAAQAAGVGAFSAIKPGTLSEVVGTRFGVVWTIAAACWLVVLLGNAAVGRLRTLAFAVAPFFAFILFAPGLSGHASTQDPMLLVPANALHVTAMGVWLGGLVAVLYVVPRGRRPDAAIGRFSDVALVAVATLLFTGLLQAIVEIRQLNLVTDTAYGRAVLIKIVILLVLIGLGAMNRVKGVRRATLKTEVALIAVVLGVTGALTGYEPARSATSGPFAAHVLIGPQRMDATVDPATVGANAVHVYLTDPKTGASVDSAKEVEISASLAATKIGPLTEQMTKSGPGHYTITALALGVRGDWKLTFTVRVSEFDQFEQTVGVEIR